VSEAVGPDAIANTDTIYLSILSDSPGTVGVNGVTSGQMYVFTTDASTASGQVRFAGGTLFLHESDRSTPTAVNLTTLWQNLTPGSIIQIIDETTPTNFANYTLGFWAGNPPKNGTVYELPATATGAGGAIANNANVRISFGLKGATGTPGSGSTIVVREIDGTPTGTFSTLEVPNTSLTDVGGGVARLAFSAGNSAGGTVIVQQDFTGVAGQALPAPWGPAGFSSQRTVLSAVGNNQGGVSPGGYVSDFIDLFVTSYRIVCLFEKASSAPDGAINVIFRSSSDDLKQLAVYLNDSGLSIANFDRSANSYLALKTISFTATGLQQISIINTPKRVIAVCGPNMISVATENYSANTRAGFTIPPPNNPWKMIYFSASLL
jgi:hypothetical protein